MKKLYLTLFLLLTGCSNHTLNIQNNYHEGLAIFDDGKRFGFVNREHKIVIPAIFWKVYNFSEGLAGVCLQEHKKCGYINHKGEFVIKPKFNDVYKFKNSKAKVYYNGKYFLIDKNGNFTQI